MYELISSSSNSSNGLISVNHSIRAILVVNSFPLIVIVVHDISVTMDDWLHKIGKEKERDKWKCNPCPVS